MPIDPVSMDASSVKMSPKRFSATTTSKSAGRESRCMVAASTKRCSISKSGYSFSIIVVVTDLQSCEVAITFALSTDVSLFFLFFDKSAATLTIRSISVAEYSHTSFA